MSLGEKTRKLFLKLGMAALPLITFGGLGFCVTNLNSGQTDKNADAVVSSQKSEKDIAEEKSLYSIKKIMPVSMAIAGICLLGAYGTYRAKKARKVIEAHRGMDWIFDYPSLLSAATTIVPMGAMTVGRFYDEKSSLSSILQREPAIVSAGYLSIGIAAWCVAYSLFDRVSRFKSPCLKNFAKMHHYAFMKPPSRAVRKSLKILAVEDADVFAERARAAINEGRSLDAIYNFNASLNYEKRRSALEEVRALNFLDGLSRTLSVKIGLYRNNLNLRKEPANISLLTNKEFMLLSAASYSAAKTTAQEILALSACTDEDRILQSFVFDVTGDAELADGIRQEVFARFIKGCSTIKIGKSLLFSKTGRRERLGDESILMQNLQQYCQKYDFEVARPLGLWDSGRECYLFETFSDGVPLFDYLEHNGDFEVLRKAARTQSVLHGVMKREGDYFLKDDISSFLGSVPEDWALDKGSLNNALSALLMPAVRFLAPDCDGHRMNRHYNETRQITVYDLEPRGLAPVPFDYAKLLRQGRLIGSWQQQKDLLAECADNFNSLAGSSQRMDVGSFAENVLRSSPYKALRYALFAWSKPEINKAALTFLDNAKNDMYIIKNENLLDLDRFRAVADAVKVVYNALIEQSARIQPMTSH